MGRGPRDEQAKSKFVGSLRSSPAQKSWMRGFEAYAIDDWSTAENEWQAAVGLDPQMADAWLGLHALNRGSFQYLEKIAINLERLGETQRRSRATIHSLYSPIWFGENKMSTVDDVRRAYALALSEKGRLSEAEHFLQFCSSSPETEGARMRVAFAGGDYHKSLEIYQKTNWNSNTKFDADLLGSVVMARLDIYKPAVDLLKRLLKTKPDAAKTNTARYQLALLYLSHGSDKLYRGELEMIYANDVNFLDVATRLHGDKNGDSLFQSDAHREEAFGEGQLEKDQLGKDKFDKDRIRQDHLDKKAKVNVSWSKSQQQSAANAGLLGIDWTSLADKTD